MKLHLALHYCPWVFNAVFLKWRVSSGSMDLVVSTCEFPNKCSSVKRNANSQWPKSVCSLRGYQGKGCVLEHCYAVDCSATSVMYSSPESHNYNFTLQSFCFFPLNLTITEQYFIVRKRVLLEEKQQLWLNKQLYPFAQFSSSLVLVLPAPLESTCAYIFKPRRARVTQTTQIKKPKPNTTIRQLHDRMHYSLKTFELPKYRKDIVLCLCVHVHTPSKPTQDKDSLTAFESLDRTDNG